MSLLTDEVFLAELAEEELGAVEVEGLVAVVVE